MSLKSILDLYKGTEIDAPVANGLRASSTSGDCCDVDGDCSNCD